MSRRRVDGVEEVSRCYGAWRKSFRLLVSYKPLALLELSLAGAPAVVLIELKSKIAVLHRIGLIQPHASCILLDAET